MIKLNFPDYTFDIREQGQKKMIFDIVRKKLIPLTPEEWVRQHAIWLFHYNYNIPVSKIAVERELKFNNLRKRFDLVIFNKMGAAMCIVECKAPNVALSSETIIQIGMYNKTMNCPYLLITNGLKHYWFQLNEGKMQTADFPKTL